MCFYFFSASIIHFNTSRDRVAALVIAALFVALAWAVRGLLGRRPARISSYVLVAALVALPLWLVSLCQIELADAERGADNDGAMRLLFKIGSIQLQASLVGIFAIIASYWFAFREPRNLLNFK